MAVAESGVGRGVGRALLAISAVCGSEAAPRRCCRLLAFPAAALVFVYAMVRSTVLTLMRGGVVWRGTFYPLRELREHAGPLR